MVRGSGSTVTVEKVAGTDVEIVQETEYPWDGKVSITVNPAADRTFSVRVRVPDRAVSSLYEATPDANGIASIAVNGTAFHPTLKNGYAAIERAWKTGDRIDLVLPLRVQRARRREARGEPGQGGAEVRPPDLQHRAGGPGHPPGVGAGVPADPEVAGGLPRGYDGDRGAVRAGA